MDCSKSLSVQREECSLHKQLILLESRRTHLLLSHCDRCIQEDPSHGLMAGGETEGSLICYELMGVRKQRLKNEAVEPSAMTF